MSTGEVKLKPAKGRVWGGRAVATRTAMAKPELGAVGERIATAYLRSHGVGDARPLHMQSSSNFPLDLVGDHKAIEVKTGIASSGTARWRVTIGQPGKAEAAWLKTAGAEEKAAWNAAKIDAAISRKTAVVADLSQRAGTQIKPVTIGVILNPDTKTVDVHVFDGFHASIGWNSAQAKSAYVGSFHYE